MPLLKKSFVCVKIWVGHSWREQPSRGVSSEWLAVDSLPALLCGRGDGLLSRLGYPLATCPWPKGTTYKSSKGVTQNIAEGYQRISCKLGEQLYPEVENARVFPLKALVLWHNCSQDVLVECQGFQGRQEPAVLCAKTNGHMQLAEKGELSAKFSNTTKIPAEELLC